MNTFYILSFDGLFKYGRTSNFTRRMYGYKSKFGYTPEVVFTKQFKDPITVFELMFGRMIRKYRVYGEYFVQNKIVDRYLNEQEKAVV